MRSLYPSVTPEAWPEIELAITRIEWELDEALIGARDRLAESLACYRSELWRSSIVMLGSVAESVALDLIAAFERVLVPDDTKAYCQKMRAAWTTAQRFQVFERFCRPDVYGLAGSRSLQDVLEAYRTLQRLRNQCSHPSAVRIDREDASNCYSQLAVFCQKANRLTDHFDRWWLDWVNL